MSVTSELGRPRARERVKLKGADSYISGSGSFGVSGSSGRRQKPQYLQFSGHSLGCRSDEVLEAIVDRNGFGDHDPSLRPHWM